VTATVRSVILEVSIGMGKVIFDATKNDSKDVADTSKQAYKELIESGQLKGQKEEVLKGVYYMHVIPTIDELVNETLAGWEKSTVSGRLNDLKDLGLVSDLSGEAKRKSKYSGIKSKVWVLTDKGEKVVEELIE
jgi:hypothetical protein